MSDTFEYIKSYISENRLALIVALGIISSVIVPITYDQMPYLAALVIMTGIQLSSFQKNGSMVFGLLIIVLFISSAINGCFNSRFFVFIFVLISASGLLYSDKNYETRVDILTVMMDVLFVVNLMNIYAYFFGINYFTSWGRQFFSGYTPHPMWLAVTAGVANIVNVHKLMNARNKWWMGALIGITLLTVFIQITAGSRAGLLATVAGVFVYLKTFFDRFSKVIVYSVVGGIIIYLLLPLLMSDSTLLQEKLDSQDVDDNSRTELWGARLQEFASSPMFGIGFARGYVNGELVEGRLESGSGWLAVLSQTGIFAFLCVAGIVLSIFKNIGQKWLPERELFLAVFVFLCVHSCFEGYLYTSFYMPCLLFWLLAGVLMQAPWANEIEFDDEEENVDEESEVLDEDGDCDSEEAEERIIAPRNETDIL